MGALPSEKLIISRTSDPEEKLAKGLTKEGGGRPDGRPALRRTNNK